MSSSYHLDEAEIVERVDALTDDDTRLLGVLNTGAGEDAYYALAATTSEYGGNTMLNLRYVRLTVTGDEEDTWLKNGVNMRMVGEMPRKLPALVAAATNKLNDDTGDDGGPFYDDVEG
jgi:hypothetical protein